MSEVTADAAAEGQRFRAIFEAASDAMLLADDERRYLDVNPAACRLLGRTREELLSLRIEDVSPMGSDVEGAWTAFLAAGDVAGEHTIVRPDGTEVEVEFRARANALSGQHLSILRDVTARKEADRRAVEVLDLQRQLRRGERLRTLGELTGGIAHDFNNLLLGISAFAELAQERAATAEPLGDALEEIRRFVDRGSAMVRDLLAFATPEGGGGEATPVARVLEELRPLLGQLLPDGIAIELRVAADVPAAPLARGQLERVLLNLVLNARDAMPAGGTLAIAADAADGDGDGGPWIQLTVTDTGIGMPPEILDRVFDPFFTTKQTGAGSGLGLPGVLGIVQSAGGYVLVDSEPDRGTTVTVCLPGAPPADEAQHAGAPPGVTVRAADADGGAVAATGRADDPAVVLLVEDEPTIRRALRISLERRGHRVVAVADGAAALEAFAREAEHVDLVISDVVMPNVTGPQLVAALRQQVPQLPAVLMSGHAAEHLDDVERLAPERTRFASKPFSFAELLALVDELLAPGR